MGAEFCLDLETALKDVVLTPKQRICFDAIFYDGREQQDIAKELGVSTPTVNEHIQRALEKIADDLDYF